MITHANPRIQSIYARRFNSRFPFAVFVALHFYNATTFVYSLLSTSCKWGRISIGAREFGEAHPRMKQVSVWVTVGIWAFLSLAGILFALWQGYQGRAFASTATSIALLLLVMLLFAAHGFADKVSSALGRGSGLLLGVFIFLIFLIYLHADCRASAGLPKAACAIAAFSCQIAPLSLLSARMAESTARLVSSRALPR